MTRHTNEVVMDEKTWRDLTSESRDWIIYNTVINQGKRITEIESKHSFSKSYAVIGGFFGSIASFFGARFIQQ